MEKKVLVMTSTFPRWKDDTTPDFVYQLSNRLGIDNKITVLAPHYNGAKKSESFGKVKVKRFVYFVPENKQLLCYDGGIIPNMKTSIMVRLQLPFLVLSELFSSIRIIKKEKIELIHAHWMLPQGVVGAILKIMFKIPLLVTVHGSDLFPLNNILFKKLQLFVLKNANYITVNSIATRNELTKRFSVLSPRVKIIPMGVDCNVFKKRNIKKPKKYSKKRLLLFVGRLSDQKGIQYLIESMEDISRQYPDIKLLVIGTGAYEKNLQKKVKEFKLEDYIEFLGAMRPSEISRYYNYAEIFIMPSLSNKTGTEALGLTLIEAMASGCPIIGTNIGGIPNIIQDCHNGILVQQKNPIELSKAIMSLLDNRKKAVILAKRASRYSKENFSWEFISSKFEKIYHSLLK